jgi:hypothetical protein
VRRLNYLALATLLALIGSLGASAASSASVSRPSAESRLGCGYWRWPVKTGTDADRSKVNRHVVTTTVLYLRSRPKPSSYPQDGRIAPTELHTYQIDRVWLVAFKEEDDSDYHLILEDAAGRSIIAEIPSPACVRAISPWKSAISGVRSYFHHHFSVTTSWHDTHTLLDIRGLGFLDEIHGQDGVAPNGVELHPVIWIKLLASSHPSGAWCKASAASANNGYPGDYDIHVRSNQPNTEATASDSTDTWSHKTDSSGAATIRLWHQSPGEQVKVTVGSATCHTTI